MKGARKAEPPQKLVTWLLQANENWQPSYSDLRVDERTAIIQGLKSEQRGLCVYCGRKLCFASPGYSFHIEHFRPQRGPNGRPDLQLDYNNLFLSCGQQDNQNHRSQICGTKKDDWFDENRFVAPTYPACTKRFKFMLSGRIESKLTDDIAAGEMIKRLGLNHPELVVERKDILISLDNGDSDADDFWNEDKKLAKNLAHVAFEHMNRELP